MEGYDPVKVSRRVFLTPFNADVDLINEKCQSLYFAADSIICLRSADSVCEEQEDAKPSANRNDNVSAALQQEYENLSVDIQGAQEANDSASFDITQTLQTDFGPRDITTEILNSMRFKGVPDHLIKVCVGMVVILTRNLDPSNRLLNGTRLIIVAISKNGKFLRVQRMDDYQTSSTTVPRVYCLPRITFTCEFFGVPNGIKRRQFPIRPAHVMTIHKAQRGTYEKVVIDLREGVFEHGQLYVALSRATSRHDMRVLLRTGQTTIRNIVHGKLLEN